MVHKLRQDILDGFHNHHDPLDLHDQPEEPKQSQQQGDVEGLKRQQV